MKGAAAMTIDQLQSFLAVAEHLNFTRAAETLHITHPAVSQQIRTLEKELGVTLFTRSTRSVRLTDAGHLFLDDARQMLEIAERAKRRFAAPSHETIETLRLGTNHVPTLFCLKDALASLRRTRPTLHPRLEVIPFQHIFRRLDDGDLDAIIGFYEEAQPRTTYHALTEVPLVCLCPADHAFAGAASLSLDALAGVPLVSIKPPHTTRRAAALQGRLMDDRPPSSFILADSCEAATALVDAGFGVSVLPAILAPDRPSFAKVPLADTAPVSFGVYYRGERRAQPLVDALLEALDAAFA